MTVDELIKHMVDNSNGADDYALLINEIQRLRSEAMHFINTIEYKIERNAMIKQMRAAVGGCPHCEYDEADGGLYRHCAKCQEQIVGLACQMLRTKDES